VGNVGCMNMTSSSDEVVCLHTEMAGLNTEMAGLNTEMAGLNTEMAGLKAIWDAWNSNCNNHPTLYSAEPKGVGCGWAWFPQ
jgi:hypothetical protein